jgi:hypothetical protein
MLYSSIEDRCYPTSFFISSFLYLYVKNIIFSFIESFYLILQMKQFQIKKIFINTLPTLFKQENCKLFLYFQKRVYRHWYRWYYLYLVFLFIPIQQLIIGDYFKSYLFPHFIGWMTMYSSIYLRYPLSTSFGCD